MIALSTTLLNAKRWIVALSGGRDSTVLLHLMKTFAQLYSIPLVAWHVNHQLQSSAIEWTHHCQDLCDTLAIPLLVLSIEVERNNGLGVEANARTARYQAFKQAAQAGDMILLAHHQQDNAETFLHHAARGSGPKGLSAMAPIQHMEGGYSIARPLLDTPVQSIADYAKTHALSWIEDPSNQNTQYRRNYLRHNIIPVLEAAYPAASECLSRSARLCAEAESIIEEVSREDIKSLQLENAAYGWLHKERFLSLSHARQKQVIRTLIGDLKAQMPNYQHLEAWIQQAKEAPLTQTPTLEGAGWILIAHPNVICVLAK